MKKNILLQLDELEEKYQEQVIQSCQDWFDHKIKPLCDKFQIKFFAGNGDFYFENKNDGKSYEIDTIPKCFRLHQKNVEIFKMTMENYHFPCNNFGSLCNNYNPE
jgi:hypothetical protein